MKRSELKVGEEYAVLSPSQKVNLRKRWAPAAKRVRVLDTEPRWHDGGYRSWRGDPVPTTALQGFDGDGEVQATNYVLQPVSEYREADAKRSVKVLTADLASRWTAEDGAEWWQRYSITTVPISQVAMTWAEYQAIRAEVRAEYEKAEKAVERQREALKVARKEREARRDQLNNLLAATPFRAKVLDDEVAIVGPAADMGDLAALAADMVADTAELDELMEKQLRPYAGG